MRRSARRSESGRLSWIVAAAAAVAALFVVLGAFYALYSDRPARGPAAEGEAAGEPIAVAPGSTPLASPTGPLPVLQEVPEFALTAADGRRIGRADLLGRPWVVDFIFTSCAGACPILSGELARVQKGLPPDLPARLVSITVDPAHDTPEALQAYAARFGADPERWLFLTGTPDAIYSLARDGFMLAAGPSPDPSQADGPFFHSNRLVLVDSTGRVRGYYDGLDSKDVDRLARDLKRVEG